MKGYFGTREGGSHQLVLLEAVRRSTKPILELGAGESSTNQIHHATTLPIRTIEGSKEWYQRYVRLNNHHHKVEYCGEREMIKWFELDHTEWGVVFVDCQGGEWIGRRAAIAKYKDVADYVVVHDTEYSAVQGYFGKVIDGKRDFSDTFKYWIEFQPVGMPDVPATVLASNKIDLKDIVIEGVVKLNQNK